MLVGLVLVAATLRFAWANLAAVDLRSFRYDATIYDMLAHVLSAGYGFVGFDGKPTAVFPPGYPWLLSIAYQIWGPQPVVAWALNALCGGVTCALTYALGTRLFGSTVGMVAAATFALFPGEIFYAALTLSEPVFGVAFTGILYLLVRWNDPDAIAPPRNWFVLGSLLGAAGLIRGVALPFASVPIAFWALSRRHRPGISKRSVAFVLGLALVTTPWVVRNALQMGTPIHSTDLGLAFWQRHCAEAFGSQNKFTSALWTLEFRPLHRLPNPTREVELYKAAIRSGLRHIATHPWQDVSLIPDTVGYLFEHDHWAFAFSKSLEITPSGQEWMLFGTERDRTWERIADAYFFAVLVFAGLALPLVLLDRTRLGWILALTIAFFAFVHGALCFAETRYHSSLTPIFSVMAAAALVRAFSRGVPEVRHA